MYAFFILPCFTIFFIIYGLNCNKEGKKVYRAGSIFLVFCFSAIVSAFLFSIVNQVFNMEWVKSPEEFFKKQLIFLFPPLIGFTISTIIRGDWKTKDAPLISKQISQKQSKKLSMTPSRIALLSGTSSSLGYLPHLGFLLAIFFLKGPHNLWFLVSTYAASVLLGEWIFWSSVGIKPFFSENFKKAAFSDPFYLLTFVSELSFHGLLLHIVLQTDWNPLHYYLIFLGCKVISGPIQSYLSYFFFSKNAAYAFAAGLQILCFIIAREHLSSLLPITIIYGLLCNAITVARSQRATEHFETTKDVKQ